MVIGLESFKKWFKNYETHYALIGGTACDILMGEIGIEFRATRDIDMVIIAETLNSEFGAHLWEYIKTAGYKTRLKSTGKFAYYRFTTPKSVEYPAMIELFSRSIEGIILPPDAKLTPIPIGSDTSSLSAILLDDEYYNFLMSGLKLVDGIQVLAATHMIPFKVKAWLDLSERKARGEHVDSKDIRKHRNDIIRLSDLLPTDITLKLPDTIEKDMIEFFANVDNSDVYLRVRDAFGFSSNYD